ncbi:hypothetical protein PIB30_088823 [Stylosanthes scabra]|uniref:Uncharacterized protein n=1 Tax=Stylosanthes scabra TaxID=79078 RepID=A0ABU6SVJ1_9FABA|nr:hypothetical protein [Stylosanthes scabra]
MLKETSPPSCFRAAAEVNGKERREPMRKKTRLWPMFTGVCLVRSSLGLRCEGKSENGGCWFAWWCHNRESPKPPLRHQKFTVGKSTLALNSVP